MNSSVSYKSVLVIAGLVLMILAAVFAFGVGSITDATDHGLAYSGLACFIASWL